MNGHESFRFSATRSIENVWHFNKVDSSMELQRLLGTTTTISYVQMQAVSKMYHVLSKIR